MGFLQTTGNDERVDMSKTNIQNVMNLNSPLYVTHYRTDVDDDGVRYEKVAEVPIHGIVELS